MNKNSAIFPQWPAPKNIQALTTTRYFTNDQDDALAFNLATHVNDNPRQVEKNRQLLIKEYHLPQTPRYLNQIHSNLAVELPLNTEQPITADAAFTTHADTICTVLTADCLPLLICHQGGYEVAAIHAGWKGLFHNIIQQTILSLHSPPQELLAWLGPAISAKHYIVSEQLQQQFLMKNKNYHSAFKTIDHQVHMNIYQIATIDLQELGLHQIYGGEFCTFSQPQFFSYRQQPQTGRMASLIWKSSL